MATKKSVKTVEATEVKTLAQLRDEIAALRVDLVDAKRGHHSGELTNPRTITALRKKIARQLTTIRVQELAAAKEDK